MHALGASSYYFFPKNYYKKLFENDMAEAKLVNCLFEGNVVCCGIFFFCNSIVQNHLTATSSDFYKFAPTKLMLDFVRSYASQSGYEFFHLGGGLSGKNDNLLNFKKGFSDKLYNFFTIKEILNDEAYSELSKGKGQSEHFPLYRSKNC
jgi:lipid II:glycine glycyltransferase (peptidoglycan interpeptide bridge formation enzyme)